jgi:2-polyprenyl-6-methoxyphenol hydroxylase-like FAD-dependent oxidoreductase
VLISGAGIAGPALAFWLRRYGFEATVVERAAALRAGGQAVDIRGSARQVVERMGLLPMVKAAGLHERGFAFVDERGGHLVEMPVDHFGGEGIVAEIEILRGDLSRVLYEATAADVDYVFDDSVEMLRQDRTGIEVTFARGGLRRFDMVVGADGVHSRVRTLAFGDESRYVRPLGGYTAYFTLPERVETNGWFAMHNAPGGLVLGIRPAGPSTSQVMFSFLSAPVGYERRGAERQQAVLGERFASMGWEAPRVLRAMPDSHDFYFDLIAQVRMPGWTNGRVALLGDAACSPSPVTGLGTSLAMVGAYVLAGELAQADGECARAFAAYETEMRSFVKECQELPPGGLEGMLPRGRGALWLRNQSMRLMTHWPVRGLVAGMFHKAEAIALKDYSALAATTPSTSPAFARPLTSPVP